jgi:hypothetical protein
MRAWTRGAAGQLLNWPISRAANAECGPPGLRSSSGELAQETGPLY